MKKFFGIFVLVVFILLALSSCASDNLKEVPEDSITYSHFECGNAVDVDGTVAVYLNFDSDYAVNKIEIAGALLDWKGNEIHTFDATMNMDPSYSPVSIVFVDKDVVRSVRSVSFGKIKAYTADSLVSQKRLPDPEEPVAVVSR